MWCFSRIWPNWRPRSRSLFLPFSTCALLELYCINYIRSHSYSLFIKIYVKLWWDNDLKKWCIASLRTNVWRSLVRKLENKSLLFFPHFINVCVCWKHVIRRTDLARNVSKAFIAIRARSHFIRKHLSAKYKHHHGKKCLGFWFWSVALIRSKSDPATDVLVTTQIVEL